MSIDEICRRYERERDELFAQYDRRTQETLRRQQQENMRVVRFWSAFAAVAIVVAAICLAFAVYSHWVKP